MQGAHPPKLLNQIKLEFPAEAKSKGIVGKCLVVMTVGVTGIPQDAGVIRCTDPVFAKYSLNAASQYRFAPASKLDGTPFAVRVKSDINFQLNDTKPAVPVRYRFLSEPDTAPTSPDTSGLYPLTKSVTPPVLTLIGDEGYGDEAFFTPGESACDVELTIDRKGKASDVGTVHCDKDSLEKPATETLLKSKFKPAILNGNAVPVRVTVHLQLADFPPIP
jgi:outer membrane biosynthesis protein TonB